MLEERREDAPKDRWGRYLISRAGKKLGYTRVTTIAKVTDDEAALKQWANRMVITGLVNRSDLLAQASTKLDDKSALNAIAQEAITAGGGNSRANLGTALHALTEEIDLGNKPMILPGLKADVDAYTATLNKLGVKTIREYIESVIINDSSEYAGTMDRVVEYQGKLYIADLKTGTDLSYSWRSIAIQLAAYATAEYIYDWKNEKRLPMPFVDQDRAIVFHLPAGEGRCELYFVDLEAGRLGLQLALDVRAWRKRRDIESRLEDAKIIPISRQVADQPDLQKAWVKARILHLPDEGQRALRAGWPEDLPKVDECSEVQIAFITDMIASVETRFDVPFFEGDPTAKPKPRKAKPKAPK